MQVPVRGGGASTWESCHKQPRMRSSCNGRPPRLDEGVVPQKHYVPIPLKGRDPRSKFDIPTCGT